MSPNPIGNMEQLAQSLAEHIVPLVVDAIDIDSSSTRSTWRRSSSGSTWTRSSSGSTWRRS
jgi:hypothetical protein